jgi:hypothetical protein
MNKRSMAATTPKRRNSNDIQPELQADPWSRSPGRYLQKSGSPVSFSSHFSKKVSSDDQTSNADNVLHVGVKCL